MATEMGQSQRIEQGLAITPQLKRSLEILQAPTLDLHDMIVNELQTNPILEEISPAEIPEKPESVGENPDDFDGEDLQPSQNNQSDEQLKRDFVLNSIPDTQSLREYLLNESKLDAENARVAEAFEALVGAMDDRGFLDADAVENAVSKGFDEKIVRQALDMLRNSSPSGIGAFDIRDSLMLQLEHKHMGNSLAYKILEDHFDLLLKRRVNEIAEIENRTVEDVENAISEIAKLSTSPAIDFAEDIERYITPDIVYKKENQAWTAELTNEYIPKLRINPEYRQMIAEGKLRKDAESYVKEKIREGKSFMEAVEQRQNTLLKIARAILLKQPDFFESGAEALRPMTMQDVADIVQLHPTTVGRAVSEKFAETPHGLYPMKFFFNSGYNNSSGDSIASASVKEKIRDIVSSEPPQKPFSDAKIAEILAEDGITIARRTVAKYREEIGIPTKSLRKRF